MPDRIRLDGRTAIVTGAAGVIGAATMRLLAERGARIVAVDRLHGELEAAIADLPASAQAIAVVADVTSEDDVEAYVRAAIERFAAIDVQDPFAVCVASSDGLADPRGAARLSGPQSLDLSGAGASWFE